jgi:hypothetical protein
LVAIFLAVEDPGIWRSQFKTENDQERAYQIIYNPTAPLLPFSAPLRPDRRSLGEVCLAGDLPIFGALELFLEAHAIVGFEIIDEGGLSRIKSERCAFSSKPFFAFGILVRTRCFD